MWGGISSSATQMIRIRVTSTSKYSAKPRQTPAIFLPARTFLKRRVAAACAPVCPGVVGAPQLVQNRAELSSFVPQRVQYMAVCIHLTTLPVTDLFNEGKASQKISFIAICTYRGKLLCWTGSCPKRELWMSVSGGPKIGVLVRL